VGKNCDGPLIFEYEFSFTNGKDKSTKHFSADEHGMYEMGITYVVLYTLLVIFAHIGVQKKLKKQNKYAGRASEASVAVRTPAGATTRHIQMQRFALG